MSEERVVDFAKAPFLVIWETTRSCALACKHCRAEAVVGRDPWELSAAEGERLLDQAAGLGASYFILSGGDPLNRPDLEALIRRGKDGGLRVSTVAVPTANATLERMRSLQEAGLDRIAFGLDGPTPAVHDSFRGTEGSFHRTLEAMDFAHKAGLRVQVNTCLADWNFEYFEQMIGLIKTRGIVFWEIFFLIPIRQAKLMRGISAQRFEEAFERLHGLSQEHPFTIKLTEAPHYRRFAIEKERADHPDPEEFRHLMALPRGINGGSASSAQALNAGKGFLFIDHVGNICPSGFLPMAAGNVRAADLRDVYANSPLFRELRDARRLKGKCGRCEYAAVCGGSRAPAPTP